MFSTEYWQGQQDRERHEDEVAARRRARRMSAPAYLWNVEPAHTLDEMRAKVRSFIANELDNGPGWIVRRMDWKTEKAVAWYEIEVHVSLSKQRGPF